MATLQEIYAAHVADGTYKNDTAQVRALPELERLRVDLVENEEKSRGLKGLFSRKPTAPRGVYLWGGVGRGKSMLMDLFVSALGDIPVRRVHFHAFMQEVQGALHEARKDGADDAIAPVASAVAKDIRVLAFDEMQITDIADAMIVGRLFEKLHDLGVAIVTTSNRIPDDLYKDGLNRQLFLPFIEKIKVDMEVHELSSETDYRQDRLSGNQVYFTPNSAAARAEIEAIWQDLTQGQGAPMDITVKARTVHIPEFWNGVARARFYDLCSKMLGPADYLAIGQVVRLLILEDIPALGRRNFNEAKRFVTLIDTLYEAKTRLICTAAAEPEFLYLEGEGTFEFERTASRLREMQSADWGT
ncbi:cell division protein ZapE [Falsihalocynthiibacter sp. S25ZX9]|uniref:cell division protein ZapE n=1 Tax=Falsihalocynthiibacter sp. S25ZX9 TaxID=3240870 RepID=UPI003510983E